MQHHKTNLEVKGKKRSDKDDSVLESEPQPLGQ